MLCPACDHDNIQGSDFCGNCGLDLAGLDVPDWGVDPKDPLLAVPVSTLPLKDPLVLHASDTVADAIGVMNERQEGCVFVLDDDDRLAGVLTERDVCARVLVPGRDVSRTRLEEVMTPWPVALEPDDPLAWALHRMGVDGYRHVPVALDGKVDGFLSARTLLRVLVDA